MPKMTLEIYCDSLPEDYREFEETVQNSLSRVNQDYILVAADYSHDDADIERMFAQSLNDFGDELLLGSTQTQTTPTDSPETEALFKLRVTKH